MNDKYKYFYPRFAEAIKVCEGNKAQMARMLDISVYLVNKTLTENKSLFELWESQKNNWKELRDLPSKNTFKPYDKYKKGKTKPITSCDDT